MSAQLDRGRALAGILVSLAGEPIASSLRPLLASNLEQLTLARDLLQEASGLANDLLAAARPATRHPVEPSPAGDGDASPRAPGDASRGGRRRRLSAGGGAA